MPKTVVPSRQTDVERVKVQQRTTFQDRILDIYKHTSAVLMVVITKLMDHIKAGPLLIDIPKATMVTEQKRGEEALGRAVKLLHEMRRPRYDYTLLKEAEYIYVFSLLSFECSRQTNIPHWSLWDVSFDVVPRGYNQAQVDAVVEYLYDQLQLARRALEETGGGGGWVQMYVL